MWVAGGSFGTLTDRLALNQPLQRITTGEGFQFVVGGQDPSQARSSRILVVHREERLIVSVFRPNA
jgi:hypothetical protein